MGMMFVDCVLEVPIVDILCLSENGFLLEGPSSRWFGSALIVPLPLYTRMVVPFSS
jgi:hypothetical protein